MYFTKISLLALSASLISSWEIKSEDRRVGGPWSQGCREFENKRGDRLKWHPTRDTDGGAKCCLYIYKKEQCTDNSQGICRSFDDSLDFHFRSYRVECDDSTSRGPYNNNGPPPPPYEPYRPPYDPRDSYPPRPRDDPRDAYPPRSPYDPRDSYPPRPPYDPRDPYPPRSGSCRPGDRCWTEDINQDIEETAEAPKSA
jgi:hypothetical protein